MIPFLSSGVRRSPARTAAAAAWLAALGSGAAFAATETDRQYCERQEGIAKTVCLRELDRVEKAPAAAVAKPAPGATAAAAKAATNATAALPGAGPQPGGAGAAAAAAGPAPYKVVDGYHVDPQTFKGFQTWRAGACDRCHGANQEGLVGPSLINSLKTLTKSDFVATVTNGRLEKGMPSFSTNQTVVGNLDSLYAYLKGRSDGAITKAHVEKMP